MSRRSGFLYQMAKAGREAERIRAAQLRAQSAAAREAERAQRAYERAVAQTEKERARLYTESRIAQVSLQNEQIQQEVEGLENILKATLSVDDYLDLDLLKQTPQIPHFDPGYLSVEEWKPQLEAYMPADPGMKRFLPGAKEKHAQQVVEAQARYHADLAARNARETERLAALAAHRAHYDRHVADLQKQAADQNTEIDRFKVDVASGAPEAVALYFSYVLQASSYPEGFPQQAKLAYVPESKQLVVEYTLPGYSVVPEVASYKYVKARDEITTTSRPAAQRKALYSSVVAQLTIRTIHELFEADRAGNVETVVFNGYVDTLDPGTGRSIRPCLVTVRTTRDTFQQIDLSRVEPVACLKALNASVSKSPSELAPVRPVLEFNMVDPRFIEQSDVLSTLDNRPNLMELTPGEFENLISNLFQSMGLETRLTQASRDGGVDCVAFDQRPILGGKVVIQAKRYKHTVGVSAVRDLFGTVQNEGASKGILVTTSGYGKAAFDFAQGKPLELLDGANLLYLLSQHAGIDARIEVPADWKDPVADAPSAESIWSGADTRAGTNVPTTTTNNGDSATAREGGVSGVSSANPGEPAN